MRKPNTRSVKMYVGRAEPRDWYTLDVEIPASTPEDKIEAAAGKALARILDKGNVRAALWGVYRVADGEEDEILVEDAEPGEANGEQAVAELGRKLRDAVAETGVFVTSHMDELIGLLEAAVSEYLQDAADNEELPDEPFAHRYPKLCPFCQADLTRPGSVKLCYTVGDDEIYETLSRLDEAGLLEDVNDLIANGYHSDTTCSKCLNSLAEHEL